MWINLDFENKGEWEREKDSRNEEKLSSTTTAAAAQDSDEEEEEEGLFIYRPSKKRTSRDR